MGTDTRNRYQLTVRVRLSSVPDSWRDVLTTEITTTRASVVAIAARFQHIYPKPAHQVAVHLLEATREPLQIDWEAPGAPDDGPA
jgi:hypothetical protein